MSSHHRIASGRAELVAEVCGDGSPVVFLHANVCDSRMWRAQLDAIGTSNKAIAYDRRGFGTTRAEQEDFSAIADLLAVIDAVGDGAPAILVGCSQGGRIALDTALLHPSRVRGLALISPSVAGAPEPAYPADIKTLMARQLRAERNGDLDQVKAIKARLWLDGPLQAEGRVAGEPRRLFLDMNDLALRSPPVGVSVDAVPNYDRLGEISVPSLVICGDFDFPHVQQRCRHIAATLPKASWHELAGAAHLPSLDRPAEVTRLLAEFIGRLS